MDCEHRVNERRIPQKIKMKVTFRDLKPMTIPLSRADACPFQDTRDRAE